MELLIPSGMELGDGLLLAAAAFLTAILSAIVTEYSEYSEYTEGNNQTGGGLFKASRLLKSFSR